MSLQDELLTAIRPHGIDLTRLYFQFRDLGQERIDGALQGLFEAGEIYRSNNHAFPRTAPVHHRCTQCHELRPLDRMMETGICIHCVSDALVTIDQRTTRVCPRCRCEFRLEVGRNKTYCVGCSRARAAEYRSRDPGRKHRPARPTHGTATAGDPSCETLRKMTRMDSMLPGASLSGSR